GQNVIGSAVPRPGINANVQPVNPDVFTNAQALIGFLSARRQAALTPTAAAPTNFQGAAAPVAVPASPAEATVPADAAAGAPTVPAGVTLFEKMKGQVPQDVLRDFAHGRNVFVQGPKGTAKTTTIGAAAARLGYGYVLVQCTSQMSDISILGGMWPV